MSDSARTGFDNPAIRSRLRLEGRPTSYVSRPTSRLSEKRNYDILVKNRSRCAQITQKPTKGLPTNNQNMEFYEPILLNEEDSSNSLRSSVSKLGHFAKSPLKTIFGRRNRWDHSGNRCSKLQVVFTVLAILAIASGLYMGVMGWRTNKRAEAQAVKLTQLANQTSASHTNTQAAASSSNTVLKTTKPSANSLADYTVGPSQPRYILIPKLGVNARVLSVGVTKGGALQTPDNVYDTAWYNKSAKPGQPGAMLIDGHVSSWTSKGVFYGLKTLVSGDIIQIERGDGTMFTYQVVKSQVYPSGNVNMQTAMTAVDSSSPGLNLITCTGDVIPGTSQFNERIVVFAKQISP